MQEEMLNFKTLSNGVKLTHRLISHVPELENKKDVKFYNHGLRKKIINKYNKKIPPEHPILTLPSNFKIHVTHDKSDLQNWINEEIHNKGVKYVGIDCEWLYYLRGSHLANIVQISTSTSCLIYQLTHAVEFFKESEIEYPPYKPLHDLLLNDDIKKIFLAGSQDFVKLGIKKNLLHHSIVDIDVNNFGAQRMANEFLKFAINKDPNVIFSRWDRFELDENQIFYASTDAYLNVLLYESEIVQQHLNLKGRNIIELLEYRKEQRILKALERREKEKTLERKDKEQIENNTINENSSNHTDTVLGLSVQIEKITISSPDKIKFIQNSSINITEEKNFPQLKDSHQSQKRKYHKKYFKYRRSNHKNQTNNQFNNQNYSQNNERKENFSTQSTPILNQTQSNLSNITNISNSSNTSNTPNFTPNFTPNSTNLSPKNQDITNDPNPKNVQLTKNDLKTKNEPNMNHNNSKHYKNKYHHQRKRKEKKNILDISKNDKPNENFSNSTPM